MILFAIVATTATATLDEGCSALINECTIPFMPHLDSLETLDYVQQYDDICASVYEFYFTVKLSYSAMLSSVIELSIIGRIHWAIVAATRRIDRRGDNHQLVAGLNRCSSTRRSPVVYTRGEWNGDRRGDDCRDDRRDSRLVYMCTLQAIVAVTIVPTVAATIAPCIRRIKLHLRTTGCHLSYGIAQFTVPTVYHC